MASVHLVSCSSSPRLHACFAKFVFCVVPRFLRLTGQILSSIVLLELGNITPTLKQPKYCLAKDFAMKVKILNILKDRLSHRDFMRKYDVKKSTLSTNVKMVSQIMHAFGSEKCDKKRKCLRTVAHPEVEHAFQRWISYSRSALLPLSGAMVCMQMERFALKMAVKSFKAPDGWLSRFRERHGLAFKSACGENAAVDDNITAN